jgi:hypothetical protein
MSGPLAAGEVNMFAPIGVHQCLSASIRVRQRFYGFSREGLRTSWGRPLFRLSCRPGDFRL